MLRLASLLVVLASAAPGGGWDELPPPVRAHLSAVRGLDAGTWETLTPEDRSRSLESAETRRREVLALAERIRRSASPDASTLAALRSAAVGPAELRLWGREDEASRLEAWAAATPSDALSERASEADARLASLGARYSGQSGGAALDRSAARRTDVVPLQDANPVETRGGIDPAVRAGIRIEAEGPGAAERRAFGERVLERLWDSPTGRRVLSEAVAERRKLGQQVVLKIETLPNSHLVTRHGRQTVESGMGDSDGDAGWLRVNARFADFRDGKEGTSAAAAVAAHELEHLRVWGRTLNAMPERRAALEQDAANERSARIVGWLVQEELADNRQQDDDLRPYLKNPKAFWETLKLNYPLDLDASEMADPSAVYARRLESLAKEKARLENDLRVIGPMALRAIRHMGEAHGLAERLREFRSNGQGYVDSLPALIEEVEQEASKVRKRLDELKRDRKKRRALEEASRDPRYLELWGSVERDERRLKALARPPEADPKPTEQIRWADFWPLVAKDKRENPSHWTKEELAWSPPD